MNQYGIVMATRLEAEPFIRGLAPDIIEKGPLRVYGHERAFLAISGTGKVNAATAAAYLCWKYGVTMLINCGAAGAAVPGYRIGEIFHVREVVDSDRPPLSGGIRRLRPDIFEGFSTAVLATRDRPVISDIDRSTAGKTADLVDMEGAAVVQAGKQFRSQTYIFKIITDIPGNSRDSTILEAMKNTRDNMFDFFMSRVLPLI